MIDIEYLIQGKLDNIVREITYDQIEELFRDNERVLLLINTDKVIPEIRWEGSEGVAFPHIYGLLNTDAVEDILPHLWSEDREWIPNEELPFQGLRTEIVVSSYPLRKGILLVFQLLRNGLRLPNVEEHLLDFQKAFSNLAN